MRHKSKRLIIAIAGMAWLIGIVLSASGTNTSTRSSIASTSHSNEKTGRDAVLSIADGQALALAGVQAAAGQNPVPPGQMAENVFKNVQVLKGIPVDQFMGTMGVFSAALSMCCNQCHPGAGTDEVKWDVDTPLKRTARRMVTMMAAINRDNFNGRQVVTCWTCHRGRDFPVVTPSLETVYGTPIVEADDLVARAPGTPTPDAIFDKYTQALGGAARLAALTSYVAKGTSMGFGGFAGARPVEIYAKAPNQRATVSHTDQGDLWRTFDGRSGFLGTPLTTLGEYPLIDGELDGARLDAEMSFPGQIRQLLTNWRVGYPTVINDKNVQVVQGNGPRGLFATLYFDTQSGLLVRLVRYYNTPVGRVPTQIDYADYRQVAGAGIMMPYRWTFSWLDGRDDFVLTEVQPNVQIDAAKFASPNTRR